MYEPYEERRKLKINLEDLKNKFVEKTKNFRQSKWFLIVIAVVLIGTIGTYSGYVTYTAKVAETTSRITILERQFMACQENVTSCSMNLQNMENELTDCQKSNQDCDNDLQNAKSDLNICNSKNQELNNQIQDLQSSVSDWESKYNALDQNFKLLQSEFDQMECNSAKKICGFMGLNYYYLKGDMSIVCCLSTEINSCAQVTSDVTIKEINC
jgi:predicted RNase H-like nuclease (RuvC/YqgF family)